MFVSDLNVYVARPIVTVKLFKRFSVWILQANAVIMTYLFNIYDFKGHYFPLLSFKYFFDTIPIITEYRTSSFASIVEKYEELLISINA